MFILCISFRYIQWVLDYRDDQVQKKFPIIKKKSQSSIIGIVVLWGIVSKKVPIIELLGIFDKSRYCEDYGNRGPDNRGPTVQPIYLILTIGIKYFWVHMCIVPNNKEENRMFMSFVILNIVKISDYEHELELTWQNWWQKTPAKECT